MTDKGAKNINIAGIQSFFNEDSIFGNSTSNQRIECQWSLTRKSRLDWRINYFKDLRDRNIFNDGIKYHMPMYSLLFSRFVVKRT